MNGFRAGSGRWTNPLTGTRVELLAWHDKHPPIEGLDAREERAKHPTASQVHREFTLLEGCVSIIVSNTSRVRAVVTLLELIGESLRGECELRPMKIHVALE